MPHASSPLSVLTAAIPSTARTITAKHGIIFQGDDADAIIGVKSGLTRCFSIAIDGRRVVSRFAGPGSVIGLGDLDAYHYSTDAVTDCEVVAFRTASIESALFKAPKVLHALRRASRDEAIQRERALFRLCCLTADERVADFLLELSDSSDGCAQGHIAMSRVDIADHLGITVETVSRALNRFHKERIIELRGCHDFKLTNPAALRRFIIREQSEAVHSRSSRPASAELRVKAHRTGATGVASKFPAPRTLPLEDGA